MNIEDWKTEYARLHIGKFESSADFAKEEAEAIAEEFKSDIEDGIYSPADALEETEDEYRRCC